MYVRDLLSFGVDAPGDGTHTEQQSTTLKADTMRASDKMDLATFVRLYRSCRPVRVRRRTRKPLLRYTHWLLLMLTNTRLRGSKNTMCSGQAGCCEIHAPTTEVGETNGQGSCDGGRARTQRLAQC